MEITLQKVSRIKRCYFSDDSSNDIYFGCKNSSSRKKNRQKMKVKTLNIIVLFVKHTYKIKILNELYIQNKKLHYNLVRRTTKKKPKKLKQ